MRRVTDHRHPPIVLEDQTATVCMKSLVRISLLLLFITLSVQSLRAQRSVLFNFDTSSSAIERLYRIPAPFSASEVIGYAERFSSPYKATYIDSVQIDMFVEKLDTNGNNALPVSVVPAYFFNGHSWPYWPNVYASHIIATDVLLPEQAKDSEAVYAFHMGHSATDTTFFVAVCVPDVIDTVHTKVWLPATSITSKTALPVDENRDRARILTEYNTSIYDSNYYLTDVPTDRADTLWTYPNFVMVAYVTTPTGGVAELYPAEMNAITFFVEHTVQGSTVLHYMLTEESPVRIDLFDASGRLVMNLGDGSSGTGEHVVPVSTAGLVSGMYFARLKSGNLSEARRVIIAR